MVLTATADVAVDLVVSVHARLLVAEDVVEGAREILARGTEKVSVRVAMPIERRGIAAGSEHTTG